MIMSSPLRYPGGKASMAGLLQGLRAMNGLGDRSVAEPFAGGAGASLALLYLEETAHIHINDADPAIHAFWWSLVSRSDEFLNLLSQRRVSISEWRKQRKIYRSRSGVSRVERGFSAFYLNRCNRSGVIVNGGPIGGTSQKGTWKINARFTKATLLDRCRRVAEYRDRISVSCEDGIRFIERLTPESTFFVIDPPYFEKGPTLYLNALDEAYHSALAARLESMTDAAWVLTYDDCPQVRRLYRGWASMRPFSIRYTASHRRSGSELLITPKWMRLPRTQPSRAISW